MPPARSNLIFYFAKILIGLLSAPFLILFIPVLSQALTHTTKTGYDRAGRCVPVLTKEEMEQRYVILQQEQL